MLKVYICEDNESQRLRMEKIIDEIIGIDNMDIEKGLVTADTEVLIDEIKRKNVPSLFFLDIDLGCEMNGLELAKIIRDIQPRCYIVFVTTHSEMSFMTFSYKVEALDFILKDNPDELKDRVHQCIIEAMSRDEVEYDRRVRIVTIKIGNHIKNIPQDDIKYFEASKDRKVILHAKNSIIEFFGKLKDIENELDDRFIRCHRAYIANKDLVEHVDKKEHVIYFIDGDSCPLSIRGGRSF